MKQDILEQIHEIGAKRYPHEACGFIISTGNKSALIETRNDSPYPKTEFLINPDEYSRAEDMGEIIGIWHTHTDGTNTPSEADLAGCEATGVTWYLCGISKEGDEFRFTELRTFEPNGYEQDYIGRPYVFGIFDCWSICRDFYRREYGITLNDYPRIKDFWLKGQPFFDEHWQHPGFVEVTGQEPQRGDVLLFQTDASGKINHAAIYLGDGQILHHCVGRLSRRDIYGGYWLKHTVRTMRHESNVTG